MSVEETHVFICDVCDKRETKDNKFKPYTWIRASVKTDGTEWGTEFLVCNSCRNQESWSFFKTLWGLMHPRKDTAK